MKKEELAIREVIDRFIEAYNRADVDTLIVGVHRRSGETEAQVGTRGKGGDRFADP